jgi:homoserine kinase
MHVCAWAWVDIVTQHEEETGGRSLVPSQLHAYISLISWVSSTHVRTHQARVVFDEAYTVEDAALCPVTFERRACLTV